MLIFICALLTSNQLWALGGSVIYGNDGRKEVYEAPSLYKKMARSVAAKIHPADLDPIDDITYLITAPFFGKFHGLTNICKDEPFIGQRSASRGTGFLVGSDILLTAGHAVPNAKSCEEFRWVFDYQLEEGQNPEVMYIPAKNVYTCKKIIEHSFSITDDYALIRLDRKVVGRKGLKFRRKGKVRHGTPLVAIGTPIGLPLKVSLGAKVRENDIFDHSFFANIDAYAGNSGSPVINRKTEMVEGILVAGEIDFVQDEELQCKRSKQCPNDGCRGERVVRMSMVKWLQNNKPIN